MSSCFRSDIDQEQTNRHPCSKSQSLNNFRLTGPWILSVFIIVLQPSPMAITLDRLNQQPTSWQHRVFKKEFLPTIHCCLAWGVLKGWFKLWGHYRWSRKAPYPLGPERSPAAAPIQFTVKLHHLSFLSHQSPSVPLLPPAGPWRTCLFYYSHKTTASAPPQRPSYSTSGQWITF